MSAPNFEPKRQTNTDEDFLSLGLGLSPRSPPPISTSIPDYTHHIFIYPPPQTEIIAKITSHLGPVRQACRRKRVLPRDVACCEGKSETITPPYPWATNRRAAVHDLKNLEAKDIKVIKGEVQCKKCNKLFEIGFDLREKFHEVMNFILSKNSEMRDRAPHVWMNPVPPDCRHCNNKNCTKPVIGEKKKSINWLLLLVGQMVGCCTLEQLKYFCKHTMNHRTGAKDHVLYLTYLALCKQLQPKGLFSYPR